MMMVMMVMTVIIIVVPSYFCASFYQFHTLLTPPFAQVQACVHPSVAISTWEKLARLDQIASAGKSSDASAGSSTGTITNDTTRGSGTLATQVGRYFSTHPLPEERSAPLQAVLAAKIATYHDPDHAEKCGQLKTHLDAAGLSYVHAHSRQHHHHGNSRLVPRRDTVLDTTAPLTHHTQTHGANTDTNTNTRADDMTVDQDCECCKGNTNTQAHTPASTTGGWLKWLGLPYQPGP
jgi:hypothetical protein